MKERTGAAIVAVDVSEIIVGINIESATVRRIITVGVKPNEPLCLLSHLSFIPIKRLNFIIN